MNFAQIVKEIRTELDMSQEQLARELHVSFATINRWENGKNSPNMLTKKVFYEYCKEKKIKAELIQNILDN